MVSLPGGPVTGPVATAADLSVGPAIARIPPARRR